MRNEHKIKVNKVSELIKKYYISDKKYSLRFYHGSTNSTRPKNKKDQLIDISDLNEVIEINTQEKYVLVEPGVSMEKLVDDTLKYGLIPPVVMEFPRITCGGAVNGASLESSSFKYGQLSDICEEYEIILGNGEIINASKNVNADIFYGISGSYGSLGVLSLIKIKLIDAKKYVKITYQPTRSFQKTLELMKNNISDEGIDYLDAITFSKSEGVVMTGELTDENILPVKTYSKAMDLWFYERAKETISTNKKQTELIPIDHYLFRYDRGAFWMGKFAFPTLGIPDNKLTRFLFNGYAKTHKLFEALHAANLSQNFFLQDIYFPFEKTLNCLEYNEENLGVYPLWLCPIKSTSTMQKLSPHFIDSEMLIDVGIWGQTKKYIADPIGINRNFEDFTTKHNGRKMLYAHAYYPEDEFWTIYDKDWYDKLRKKYHAEKVFKDVWQKTHVAGRIVGSRWWGLFKYFFINPIKKSFNNFL